MTDDNLWLCIYYIIVCMGSRPSALYVRAPAIIIIIQSKGLEPIIDWRRTDCLTPPPDSFQPLLQQSLETNATLCLL